MKYSLSMFALALPLAPLANASITTANSQQREFMKAMRSTQIQTDRTARLRRLNAAILSSAIPVPSNQHQHQHQHQRDKHTDNNTNNHRDLERKLGYYNDDAQNYDEYGFDMSSYSLKYAGCSAIATYSDDLAQDEDAETVFESDQYVIFRFCPTDYCSSSSVRGCQSNYGEYMVPIATWLDVIAAYREDELERYCEYCDGCYGGDNRRLEDNGDDNANANGDDNANANGDDNANANGDDNANANGDDNANANGDDNANANGDDNANNAAGNCSYESECSGYADVCNDNQNDGGNIDYSKFFECKEVDVSDDLTLYVGPQCASDKTTILLGVFMDEDCTVSSGSTYDLATITGQMLNENDLSEFSASDCIACKESDLAFQNYDNDNQDNDDINQICETLYGYSAKCNRYMSSASSSSYQSYQQEDNEYAVCSFIASVVTGSYDENGFIYVDPLSFDADNKYNEYSKIAIRRSIVTPSQFLSLICFSILSIGMGFYAYKLKSEIDRLGAFSDSKKEPLGMYRQNSGIMMARSNTFEK